MTTSSHAFDPDRIARIRLAIHDAVQKVLVTEGFPAQLQVTEETATTTTLNMNVRLTAVVPEQPEAKALADFSRENGLVGPSEFFEIRLPDKTAVVVTPLLLSRTKRKVVVMDAQGIRYNLAIGNYKRLGLKSLKVAPPLTGVRIQQISQQIREDAIADAIQVAKKNTTATSANSVQLDF